MNDIRNMTFYEFIKVEKADLCLVSLFQSLAPGIFIPKSSQRYLKFFYSGFPFPDQVEDKFHGNGTMLVALSFLRKQE
jgi:hypothetical protein